MIGRLVCRTVRVAVCLLVVFGCDAHDHPHGEEAHGEHAEHEGGHGHEHHPEATAYTHFSDSMELFVEVPPLVVGGEPAELAAHFTRLSDFLPVAEGKVVAELAAGGAAVERFEVEIPAVAGIFKPVIKPAHAGRRRLVLRLEAGGLRSEHDLGEVQVHPSPEAWKKAEAKEEGHHDEEGGISFLKEQQWKMEFGLTEVTRRRVRPSFAAYGTLRPRSDGEAYVSAPVSGRLDSGGGFPRIGLSVERDEVLARLTPRLAEIGDAAALSKTLNQAQIAVRHATQERDRLSKLLAAGAIPERRVVDARFTAARARAALDAARSRSRQARRAQSTGEQRAEGGFALRAPLGGTLVEVAVAPGAFVAEGARMFRVVDLSTLWLEVHVTETHVGHLDDVQGVWFEVEGMGTFEVGAKEIVTVAGVLDERTRTLPLVVRVENPDGRLKVGMFASAHVVTGAPREVPAVPSSAVLREGGLPVVYVQADGERFERRTVRTGERDGEWVEIVEGVAPGERVVSRGAYAVRLAGSADQIPSHGHAH